VDLGHGSPFDSRTSDANMQPINRCGRMYPARSRASERSGALFLGRAMLWDQRFFDPIKLSSGHELVTLRDAALYIMKLQGRTRRRRMAGSDAGIVAGCRA